MHCQLHGTDHLTLCGISLAFILEERLGRMCCTRRVADRIEAKDLFDHICGILELIESVRLALEQLVCRIDSFCEDRIVLRQCTNIISVCFSNIPKLVSLPLRVACVQPLDGLRAYDLVSKVRYMRVTNHKFTSS